MADDARVEATADRERGDFAKSDGRLSNALSFDEEAFKLERHARAVEEQHVRTFHALNGLLEIAIAKRDAERDGAA